MSPEQVVQILRDTLLMACWIGAPLLLAGFVAGVLISLVQIVTSMQDSAVSAVPRLAAFALALFVMMPWMLKKLTAYTVAILGEFALYAR